MANSETNLPNVDNAQFHMPDINKLVGTPALSPASHSAALRLAKSTLFQPFSG